MQEHPTDWTFRTVSLGAEKGPECFENNLWQERTWDGSRPGPGSFGLTVTVPAGCWVRCTGSRWPQRPRGFSSLTAGAGQPESGAPWSQQPRSGAGFFPEATPPADWCCTLDTGREGPVTPVLLLHWDELTRGFLLQPSCRQCYHSPPPDSLTWARAWQVLGTQ